MIGRTIDAVKNYTEALRLNPKKVECYYNLGNAYCSSGRFKEAIQYYL